MCRIGKQLLAENLIDDFYEDHIRNDGGEPLNKSTLDERLKELLPPDQHDLLYRWEAECAENCGRELREFAGFCAGILMSNPCHEENKGGLAR
ncbi:hypothetical protein C7445_1214 [Alicyclobacillus sacchari]|uniref:Uncharacterized protein n=1 Tax=Alicyclobacillus sacchari TaxID=392010 RepID=A0A4V3HDC0_9BACL|nr:hypothetical protein [Alicyclobacillus sacchari]TDY40454.1 hypothetical protein C7445_1214 [Alicyclobacillus sacchari]